MVYAIFLALVTAAALAFKLSPWPSVAVCSYLFAKSDQASEAALLKHAPVGISIKRDLAYGDDRDETLYVYSSADRRPSFGGMAAVLTLMTRRANKHWRGCQLFWIQ